MVPGCKHDNVDRNATWQNGMAACPDCAAYVSLEVWRKLHPPPEPPKSWVRRKAETECMAIGSADFAEQVLRETVEECCRVVPLAADNLRRAMLEPKA